MIGIYNIHIFFNNYLAVNILVVASYWDIPIILITRYLRISYIFSKQLIRNIVLLCIPRQYSNNLFIHQQKTSYKIILEIQITYDLLLL